MLSTTYEHRPAAGFIPGVGASRVLLCGKSLIADPTGAVFWPAENTLIVADLQLSGGSYLDGYDVILPPYDTASSFEKLEDALDRYDPARVVVLGSSFDGLSSSGLSAHRTDWLQDMMEGRDWYWVTGDEDTELPAGHRWRGGSATDPERHQVPRAGHPRARGERDRRRAASRRASLAIRACRARALLRHERYAPYHASRRPLLGWNERA